MAVVVHDRDAPEQATQLAQWSQSEALPVLAVALDRRAAVVGPLTIPGRVGCGHCASQRILAAAAGSGGGGEPDSSEADNDRPVDLARTVVIRELETVETAGCYGSAILTSVLLVDPRDRSVSSHEFVPLPYCPVCGGAASLLDDGLSSGIPEPTAGATLDGWVDKLTGIIPELALDPAPDGISLPVVVTAAPPHVVEDDGTFRRLPIGWGKGLTPAEAVRSAVGEAVERYSASLPDPARVVWKRPDELASELLDPRELPLYNEEQYAREGFPYVRYDPSVRHPWVRGRWLGSGAEVWVPAVAVFLSLTVAPENMICQGTSSGLAAATDPDDAALRATMELIERDAFMIAWLTGARGTRVTIDDSLGPALREVLDGIEAQGASVELLRLPTASCGTVVICLALGDGESWPGLALGLGADLEPDRAVRKAILELGQTGPHLTRLIRLGALAVPRDERAVRGMLDHAAFYAEASRVSALDTLRCGGEIIALGDLVTWDGERSLEACSSALDAAGIRIAMVDVTAPDVVTGPFRVARAVSPDLQPISYGYGLERIPVKRARTLARLDASPIHPIW